MTARNMLLATAATLFVAAPVVFAAVPASTADRTFVASVSQGGAYEVAASKVAVQRATTPDVKDQAITEVHDHELVGQELKRIAAATGIPVAPELNAEFQQRLAALKATPSGSFDAAYIADMKTIHDKDEKLFAKEGNEGSVNFKTFAHQTDLIVKRHIGALHGTDQ